jgi:16S rRNA G527 N7-methylase RsmG
MGVLRRRKGAAFGLGGLATARATRQGCAVMDRAAVEDALGRLLEALGAELPEATRSAWVDFAIEGARWNRHLNLSGARTAEALVEVFFADAVVLLDVAEALPPGARFVDVGAGAGAPAIPLALARDDLTGLLVEPIGKRVSFLRGRIGAQGLADRVTVLGTRLDPVAPALPEPVDVAMSRATFDPATWLRLGSRLGCDRVLVFGVDALPRAPEGLRIGAERRYAWPLSGRPRHLGVYQRT